MKKNDWFKLIATVVIANLAGLIGSVFTASSLPIWYAALVKPALNPPGWIFAPVWTLLYVLMGVAAFLIWRRGLDKREVKVALGVFIAQLVLNALWSIIFFGRHNPGAAFLEIIILWLTILITILLFWRISRPAAYLLIPYILWVSFASYLNFSIWRLNESNFDSGIDDPLGYACTMEAKLCPDGSAVGRSGPDCEFAACPAAGALSLEPDWAFHSDNAGRIQFRYPAALSPQYISTVDWPPTVSVSAGDFACAETPGTASLPSRTLKRLVDDRVYCVEAMSEGAAGSVYTEYAYTTERNGQLVRIAFTLRYPQCLNYDDPKQTECQNEREAFDLDGVVDRIAATVTVREDRAAWERIKSAISNCEVRSVMQAHSLEVSVTLKNGERISAFEPRIDEIIELAVQARPTCGSIIMATE